MKTLNLATQEETTNYYWSANSKRFGTISPGMNHGFKATHLIIIDAGLYADQIDAILNPLFDSGALSA